jgi:hypothetical protein
MGRIKFGFLARCYAPEFRLVPMPLTAIGVPSDGRTLTIDGPQIRIPSGARRITGEYSRHAFRYVGPAGDPESGA